MSVDSILGGRAVIGVKAFDELPVTGKIWQEAHDHHHAHRRLHAIKAHRPGIVYGLEVISAPTPGSTLIIAPGMAVDDDGNVLLLRKPVSFNLVEPQMSYLILTYQAAPDQESKVNVSGGVEMYRFYEACVLTNTKTLPATPYIELARVFRSRTLPPIKNAADACDPGHDEINLLHRRVAFPHCFADVAVGEVAYVPRTNVTAWKPNRVGLVNLLREGSGYGFHLDFSGLLSLGGSAVKNPPAMVYMAGKEAFTPLEESEIAALKRYLAEGGFLFAESCVGDTGFAAGFTELATALGANLAPVAHGSPLLSAHYVFSRPPAGGAASGELKADLQTGILFSTYDYGGAWRGAVEEGAAQSTRTVIREAMEFGLNVLRYAAGRQRAYELSQLG